MKTSGEEIAKLISITGGNDEEKAAAGAVVSALLAQKLQEAKSDVPGWTAENRVREGLGPSWQGRLRS
jgi:hypothetical protein